MKNFHGSEIRNELWKNSGNTNVSLDIKNSVTEAAFYLPEQPYKLSGYFGFGVPANDKMLSIILLYVETMSILTGVALIITLVIGWICNTYTATKNKIPIHFSKKVEAFLDTLFALIPTVLISYLLIPALGFIFQLEYDENFLETLFNVYIIGHQWYWTYEIDTKLGTDILINLFDVNFNFPILQYDSYMLKEDVGAVNRLLNVDKSLVLPTKYNFCFYITSHDVIHSWAVPQFGIKMDALPGRLMRFVLYPSYEGVYYGQCSELCGVNHAFMPICVQIVKSQIFMDWLLLSLDCNLTADSMKIIMVNRSLTENYFSDSLVNYKFDVVYNKLINNVDTLSKEYQ